jgi:glycosyltransferase involved in cell wall biosynthesis
METANAGRWTRIWRRSNGSSVLAALRESELIVSICVGLLYTGELSHFAKKTHKPIISIATGSDIREMPYSPSLYGYDASRMARDLFAKSKIVFLANLDQVFCARKLALPQWKFYPFPIDTRMYCPLNNLPNDRDNDKLVIFHPSALDWSYRGNERSSTKGNDRFLRAFAKFAKERPNVSLKMLSRGPDVEQTKQLVRHLGIDEKVEFEPDQDFQGLIRNYQMADVVVDQFDVGAFGGIALQAMACAKPVMIYINTDASDLVYVDPPPVLNCRTEEQIYDQLLRAEDKAYREAVGRNAREWIVKYHDCVKVMKQLVFQYESVLGESLGNSR